MNSPPKKPDFSNVRADVTSTEAPRADFSNVQATVFTTEPVIEAGGGAIVHTHAVVKGDTLSAIAKSHYGKASHWPKIFEANRDQLDNPDRIKPGQILKIPSLGDGTA